MKKIRTDKKSLKMISFVLVIYLLCGLVLALAFQFLPEEDTTLQRLGGRNMHFTGAVLLWPWLFVLSLYEEGAVWFHFLIFLLIAGPIFCRQVLKIARDQNQEDVQIER